MDVILCSNCFIDQGLKLDALRLGVEDDSACPICGTNTGRKLDKSLAEHLAHRFFVKGTMLRTHFGGAPRLQFNELRYPQHEINFPEGIDHDVRLIENAIKIGVFHYGPRLWMVGENEPLKKLQSLQDGDEIIAQILALYPARNLTPAEIFYRLRKGPVDPTNQSEYDSPPPNIPGSGRLDSSTQPVMYASQDLEVCVHECRAITDDELYIASLVATKELNLLDLTEIINQDVNEFESIDIAVYLLFSAGERSYEILRAIAKAANDAGFDGLIYPSYFSLLRTGGTPFATAYGISIRRLPVLQNYAKSHVIPNVALFGRPIHEGKVSVKCINRLVLHRVDYDIGFGPVGY